MEKVFKATSEGQFELTPEELAVWEADIAAFKLEQTAVKLVLLRKDRNQRLADSDWVVSRAYETGTPVPQVWVTYRQALRDVPQQPGFPDNIQWPAQPE